MLLPFYGAEQAQDPEVVHITEDVDPTIADPSITVVVNRAQKEAYKHRTILGIRLPLTHRPTVVPYSWR